ncbi:MAG: hypothetical protein KDC09_14630 [Bacteroidales bacterium]|nr:hypothetical protein [Bacteroidales bacterium]
MQDSGLKRKIAAWGIFIMVIMSGFMIATYPSFDSVFLTLLSALAIMVVVLRKNFNAFHVTVSRSLLGLLFLFSGFVKGVDPVGTQYRIEDYFIAFGTEWAMPLALPMSVILNGVEFILGGMLLLNIRVKSTILLVLFVMFGFTIVTINDAMNNPVPDCGCFGDALTITNWQTFYKNLVIDALLLIVLFGHKRTARWFSNKTEWIITVLIIVGFTYFQVYNIRHLPMLDFRNWKVGKKMINENPLPQEFYLTYRNTETGEEKEYLSPNYPYDDSVWMSKWEFAGQRYYDPNPKLHQLSVEGAEGGDYTANLIENPDYQFLIVMENIDHSNTKKMDEIKTFIDQAYEQGVSVALLTSSLPETVLPFLEKYNLTVEPYYADDVTLKAMIRANPGLLLLKDGVILGKWHYNDWPTLDNALNAQP